MKFHTLQILFSAVWGALHTHLKLRTHNVNINIPFSPCVLVIYFHTQAV